MIRLLLVGAWACLVTVAASYLVGSLPFDPGKAAAKPTEVKVEGLTYHNLPQVTVPMINDGTVQGYVVAKFIYTGDARTLQTFPIEVQPFLADETFRQIYQGGRIDFRNIAKYDVEELTKTIRKNVNTRLGVELIKDILVSDIAYVEHSDTRSKK